MRMTHNPLVVISTSFCGGHEWDRDWCVLWLCFRPIYRKIGCVVFIHSRNSDIHCGGKGAPRPAPLVGTRFTRLEADGHLTLINVIAASGQLATRGAKRSVPSATRRRHETRDTSRQAAAGFVSIQHLFTPHLGNRRWR